MEAVKEGIAALDAGDGKATAAQQQPAGIAEVPDGLSPDKDPKLVMQAAGALLYHIPKSTLSAAAKKEPGTPGHLWSEWHTGHRYYRRDDLEQFAKSHKELRKPATTRQVAKAMDALLDDPKALEDFGLRPA